MPTRTPAFVLATLVLFPACRDAPAPSPPQITASAPVPASSKTVRPESTPLTRVTASSFVCMVNDRFMGGEQIPVSIDGKTYYGCCAACKDKLQSNAAVRTAVDPVTRRPVDKAMAVIGKTDSGTVLYFESEDTFARYGGRD
jgi:YHS domain-containing protein